MDHMHEDDDYTNAPTKLRIFDEGDGWALDGANDAGKFTQSIWKYDSPEECLAQIPAFIPFMADEMHHDISGLNPDPAYWQGKLRHELTLLTHQG